MFSSAPLYSDFFFLKSTLPFSRSIMRINMPNSSGVKLKHGIVRILPIPYHFARVSEDTVKYLRTII